jgi:hypothetical protein
LLSVQVKFGWEKNAAWSLESTTRSPTVPTLPPPPTHTHILVPKFKFIFLFFL